MSRVLMERSGEMEVFAQVVRDGAFSAAARNLDLTPSAVSKLIARLEARLGAQLLVRTTRALRLTEEGEAYHRAAVRILQDLSEAEHAAAGGSVRGHLRVNAAVPFGAMFVAPAVAVGLVALSAMAGAQAMRQAAAMVPRVRVCFIGSDRSVKEAAPRILPAPPEAQSLRAFFNSWPAAPVARP